MKGSDCLWWWVTWNAGEAGIRDEIRRLKNWFLEIEEMKSGNWRDENKEVEELKSGDWTPGNVSGKGSKEIQTPFYSYHYRRIFFLMWIIIRGMSDLKTHCNCQPF